MADSGYEWMATDGMCRKTQYIIIHQLVFCLGVRNSLQGIWRLLSCLAISGTEGGICCQVTSSESSESVRSMTEKGQTTCTVPLSSQVSH